MKNTWPILVFISLLFFNGSAAASISGDWKLAPVPGAFGVGFSENDTSWWASDESTVFERACLFDDIFRFDADGSFSLTLR